MNALSQLTYLAWWFIRARFTGRRKPLQSVVFVTNGCDSTCRHCTVCTRQGELYAKPFTNIEKDLDECYALDARMLDLEGVHLLHWQDGEHKVNDIFTLAKDKGFYSTSTMIPAADYAAWEQLNVDVDVLWVSIMGIKDCSYLENLRGASLYMVVNSQNYQELPAVLEFLQQQSQIRQIAFNFHTPFQGTEHLALNKQQREEVIKQLIAYKRRGYRIMNSVSGLKNMLTLNFTRRCWICNFIYCDGRRSPQCIDNLDSGICQHCGFSMAGEMNAVFSCKPDTILAGLGIRL
ncbi:MAG: radical SAM protein [Bacteroidaceae bacterium]|nr:radical SAM protein [Bacteroidaceae bacterium]